MSFIVKFLNSCVLQQRGDLGHKFLNMLDENNHLIQYINPNLLWTG
uniref:Uncharacterized protein n=1 Tax=Otus sunia TaxID=257818 RepID=A0A8C8ADN4_9STRI